MMKVHETAFCERLTFSGMYHNGIYKSYQDGKGGASFKKERQTLWRALAL